MTGTSELQHPRPASDSLILGVVAAYAAVFVVFGLLVQPPAGVLRGLGAILTTRDALLTDYFGVGGIGAGCVSAGLLTLAGALVYWRAGVKMTGASVAALFLVLGFGLFGKNLLNVWPIVAGVALYARFRGEPFRAHLNTAFFGGALAPIFSEILFSTDLTPIVSVPLALLTGLAVGFILPPAAAHLSRAHMGFSLYNMGSRPASSARSSSRCTRRSATCPTLSSSGQAGRTDSSAYFLASSSPRWSSLAGSSTGVRSDVCRLF